MLFILTCLDGILMLGALDETKSRGAVNIWKIDTHVRSRTKSAGKIMRFAGLVITIPPVCGTPTFCFDL